MRENVNITKLNCHKIHRFHILKTVIYHVVDFKDYFSQDKGPGGCSIQLQEGWHDWICVDA